MQDDILALAYEVSRVTEEKVGVIDSVMRRANVLALNARLEAARAGSSGNAFSVVAQEMGMIAQEISRISGELQSAIAASTELLETAGEKMTADFRGTRFTDLARTAIDIIDRNLYERSCDVRWWATESALVEALASPTPEAAARASTRLGVILRSYTVYLDLWLVDRDGIVIATGRPQAYRQAPGAKVADADWFRRAMHTTDGAEFVVCDIDRNALLDQQLTATYATAIRRDGDSRGEPIGALGIFFDWGPQAAAVLNGIGLTESEQQTTRVMILNAAHKVIAASDGSGLLTEHFPLATAGRPSGFYRRADRLVAYALTPGYETYQGLGWYGCIDTELPSPTRLERRTTGRP